MKAARIHSFGGPEVLQVEEVEAPKSKGGEVLVRVGAASVNPVDYKIRQGEFSKVSQHDLPIILGRDVCGTVEGNPGKSGEVMALLNWGAGGYAEIVAVPEALCVPKPGNLSAVEAAAVPLAAMTAWQGLFDHGQLQKGQRVLIHAGSGGVGHFAVQLAATRGSTVISTASKDNLDFVKSLGAETVIDYQSQRFEDVVSEVDVVFDLVGGETRERSWKVLRCGGFLVSTLGQPRESGAGDLKPRQGVSRQQEAIPATRCKVASASPHTDASQPDAAWMSRLQRECASKKSRVNSHDQLKSYVWPIGDRQSSTLGQPTPAEPPDRPRGLTPQ